MRKSVIIVAGGSGKRMQSDVPKQFLLLAGKPVIVHSAEAFFAYDNAMEIIMVLPENQIGHWEEIRAEYCPGIACKTAVGGKERFFSVMNGLQVVSGKGLIAVHDAVRPLVSLTTIENCFRIAQEKGNAIPVTSITESVRLVENGSSKSEDRTKFRIVQTPQVFRVEMLKNAYRQQYRPFFTDDASVLEAAGQEIFLAEGNRENIKITTRADLVVAEGLMKAGDQTNLR